MNNHFSSILSDFKNSLINLPGWRTRKKIVVIESDDWGSIRMPSKKVYDEFISKGLDISGSIYNRIDSLETNQDLEMLYEVLDFFRNKIQHSPVLTANCVMANPDFQKIRDANYEHYYYEPVNVTLQKADNRKNVESLWIEGNEKGIFRPQYHGREHVNVVRWMDALQRRTPEIMFTFDKETTFSGQEDYNFMEVLDYNGPEDISEMKNSLAEGLNLFENVFGYRSKSFIPPCYTWDSNVEETLSKGGVRYIQGIIVQFIPTGSFGNYKKRYHFLGNKNKYGQYFLVRNAFFEPALTTSSDSVGECLRRINIAFRFNKPAIIGSHRINYIGSLDERNRSDNLKLLKDLLKRIIKQWPDVVFMSSDKLGDLIAGSSEKPK